MKCISVGLRLVVLVVLTAGQSVSVRAQSEDQVAQSPCDASHIDGATNQYDVGLFDDVVETLSKCLPDGFEEKSERIGAYRLLALSYIVTDSLDHAQESIRQLLKTDSGYQPDTANDPPLFASMVQDMKPSWYTFMWKGNSTTRWAGRVAVVGAAVAVPFLLQDTSLEPLPGPPPLPTGAGN